MNTGIESGGRCIDVWTEAEFKGCHELPKEYDRVASHHNNKHQNNLDPEKA